MTIDLNILKGSIISVLVGILLVYRNIEIGVAGIQIVEFAAYYISGCAALTFSLIKYKNIINPISIYVIFIFLMSYSFIRLSSVQEPYEFNTLIILNTSIVLYLSSASLNLNSKPLNLLKIDNRLKRYFLYTICLFSLLTFISEVVLFGYLPVLQIGASDVYIDTNAKLIPFLHYFIVLLAFVPAWSYILFKEQVISKRELRVLLLITLFILINYLSRQLYLLLGITFFMSYAFYNKVNTKILFRASILVITLFMLVGFLKFNPTTTVSFSEFSRLAAGIDNDNVSIMESTFVEYSSKRFTALNEMVKIRDKIGYLGFGTYTFRPFLSFFLLEKSGIVVRVPELDSDKNVGTYAIDPYLDFGLIGVIFLNALYGFLASRYYHQYNEKHPEAIIKFSIIIFCIFMGMFINYFNTMLIWLGMIVNKFLLGGIGKKREI